jgi:hypothetical protein
MLFLMAETKLSSTHTHVYSHTVACVVSPPPPPSREVAAAFRIVAPQVAFERQTLKPVFHLIGYRFERL